MGVTTHDGTPVTVPGYAFSWGFYYSTVRGRPIDLKEGEPLVVRLIIHKPMRDSLDTPIEDNHATLTMVWRYTVRYQLPDRSDWGFVNVLMPFDTEIKDVVRTVENLCMLAAMKVGYTVEEIVWA